MIRSNTKEERVNKISKLSTYFWPENGLYYGIADEYQQIDDNTDIANSRFADSANKGGTITIVWHRF